MKRFYLHLLAVLAAALVSAHCGLAHGQLVSHAKERQLRKFFPRTTDEDLNAVFAGKLLLYTDREMPAAYQKWDGMGFGVHSPAYNISGDAAEAAKGHGRGGNANVEFPWKEPGGTDSARVETFRFVRLPTVNGRQQPVVWFRRVLSGGDTTAGFSWVFPNDTIVGEVLYMRGPDGYGYTFEVRTRTKVYGHWGVNIYRPFPTAASLASGIKRLRAAWQENQQLRAVVERLEHPSNLQVRYLGDDRHVKHPAFRQWAIVSDLPGLGDDKLVAELLRTTPFEPASGEAWLQGRRYTAYAPTTNASWHIVPRGYTAGFIDVGETSCKRCHESANKRADFFEDVFTGRQWYGRVRGSDQIFSFHPFSPDSISYNGAGGPVAMRRELEAAGLLERYDPRRHSSKVYHMLSRE